MNFRLSLSLLVIAVFAGFSFAEVLSNCSTLSTSDTTYTLNQSINASSGTCINVSANNVTIDCNGYSITGGGTGSGVYSEQFNTTVRNCNIMNFETGIDFSGADNGTITDSNVSSSTDEAIYVGADGNTLSNLVIDSENDQESAVYIDNGDYNMLTNITVTTEYSSGIELYEAEHNTITDCNAYSETGIGILVHSESGYNVIANNTAISNATDDNCGSGEAGYSFCGALFIGSSSYNLIDGNNLMANEDNGIRVSAHEDDGDYNNITNNRVTLNSGVGIILQSGPSYTIVENNSVNANSVDNCPFNYCGAFFDSDGDYNTIHNNNFTSHYGYGIRLSSSADYNVFTNNSIRSDDYVIYIQSGSENEFYHNKIISDYWVYDDSGNENYFDDGDSEGNIYLFGDGRASWGVFDITTDSWYGGWATGGDDQPFDSNLYSSEYDLSPWSGSGQDSYPWVGVLCGEVPEGDVTVHLDGGLNGSGNCFEIYSSNVTVDCDGNWIAGDDTGTGIYVEEASGTNIQNCNITDFYYGIHLQNSSESQILYNSMNNMAYFDEDEGIGLYMVGAHNNIIHYNNFTDDFYGFALYYSDNNSIGYSSLNMVIGNFAPAFDGSPGSFMATNPVPAGGYMPDSVNNTVFQNNFTYGIIGVLLYGENGTSIIDNNIAEVYYGIAAIYSEQTNITGNYIENGTEGDIPFVSGILLMGCNETNIDDNIINNSLDYAINIEETTNTVVLHNTIIGDYWVADDTAGNTYNDETSGNYYYLANGSGAWTLFPVYDTNEDGWADTGPYLPYGETKTPDYWAGEGSDAHPYTEATPSGDEPESSHRRTLTPISWSHEFDCETGLLTLSSDGGSGTLVRVIRPSDYYVMEKETDGDGKAIFTITQDGTYQIYQLATAQNPAYTSEYFQLSLCTIQPPVQNVTPPAQNVTPPANVTNQTQPPEQNQTPTGPSLQDAKDAIAEADNIVFQAMTNGKDTQAARDKLAQAQEALNNGLHADAIKLAEEAANLAKNAKAVTKPPETTITQTTSPITPTAPQKGSDWLMLLVGLAIPIVVLVAVGVYLFTKKGKKPPEKPKPQETKQTPTTPATHPGHGKKKKHYLFGW